MKRILSLLVMTFLMSGFMVANAVDLYSSYTATSFDDDSDAAIWVAGPGFDWGSANATDSTYNHINNQHKTLTLLIDGYEESCGTVRITLARLWYKQVGDVAPTWGVFNATQFYSDEDGALNPALTAADFTDGRATIEITIPAGTKPSELYDDQPEGCGWMLQIATEKGGTDDASIYMNHMMVVDEEIVESTPPEEFAGLYGSISATSFDDEGDGVVWVAAPGFDYGWNGAPSEANMYSNERNTVNLLIDGYASVVGDVYVKVGRLSFSSWDFLDDHFYYSNEAGSENPPLTAADFTDGRATLALTLPAGMKPWDTYGDLEADEFRGWTVQVIGSNSSPDSESGETYMNFVIGVTEEITGSGNGVVNLSNAEMNVYPNPVKSGDQLHIDASEFNNNITVNIYSLSGQRVSTQRATASSQISVNANFKPGIYSMEITDGVKRSVKKIAIN